MHSFIEKVLLLQHERDQDPHLRHVEDLFMMIDRYARSITTVVKHGKPQKVPA